MHMLNTIINLNASVNVSDVNEVLFQKASKEAFIRPAEMMLI